QRRGHADHGEHVLGDEVLSARVRGARVVLRVAPHVLDLASVDAAGGVDALDVSPHRVALHRGVDRPADVEEAADRDGAAADPRLGLRTGASAAGRGGGLAVRCGLARHLARRAEPAEATLLEGEDRHHSEHRGDDQRAGHERDGDPLPDIASYHWTLRVRSLGHPESGTRPGSQEWIRSGTRKYPNRRFALTARAAGSIISSDVDDLRY